MNKICTIDFCDRPTLEGRKLCPGHKEQVQKGQTLRPVNPYKRKTDDEVEWFWRFVDKSADCWVWTRARQAEGYGVYTGRGKTEQAHRVSYEFTTGESIPTGLEIDHICRNPPCVRPDHLRQAKRPENAQNLSLASNSTTGVRGVTRTKNGKFQAQAQKDKTYRYLGVYDTLEEAAEVATRVPGTIIPVLCEGGDGGMKDRTIPWTSDDLRAAADTIDKILEVISPEDGFLEDGDWRWGVTVDVIDDLDCVISTIKPTGDGWFGFYPKEATYE